MFTGTTIVRTKTGGPLTITKPLDGGYPLCLEAFEIQIYVVKELYDRSLPRPSILLRFVSKWPKLRLDLSGNWS